MLIAWNQRATPRVREPPLHAFVVAATDWPSDRRHGYSEYNVQSKLGGNPPLSQWGEEYARRLGEWVGQHIQHDADGRSVKARLWTSSLQRTILTAQHVPHPDLTEEEVGEPWMQMIPRIYRAIDEIFVGDAEGLTEAQFKERFPKESDQRKRDKIGFREAAYAP
eukprot:2991299-Prymnesium_polylepis.2